MLSGFIRIVRDPRTFGPRHWDIFRDLCERAGARGNLVPDANLAALAIEFGSEWVTTDGDFARDQRERVRILDNFDPFVVRSGMARYGLSMIELTPGLGDYFGTDRGVLVTDVDQDSRRRAPASRGTPRAATRPGGARRRGR